MPHILKHGISYCVIDRQCYFVDLNRNRYFTISSRLSSYFLDRPAIKPGVEDDGLAREIRGLGLIESADADCIAPFFFAMPTHVIADDRPSWWLTIRSWHGYRRASQRIGAEALCGGARILEAARRGQPSRPLFPSPVIAASLGLAKQLVGTHDLCLPWSLTTADLLIRNGHDTTVVFGICPSPFTAHCWVQCDGTLIGDSLERVGMYTPILAL